MNITLNDEECALLAGLLQSELRSVRSEIYHAESHAVKASLHRREDLVRELLGRLGVRMPELQLAA